MKIILVSGTMGVGKTTICQRLKKELNYAVFLDGDWCWDMHPFRVNDITKAMVMDNIVCLMNNFIHSQQYEYILLGWVMHQQEIIDELLERLDTHDCEVFCISLICSKEQLIKQIQKDIDAGIRNKDILQRSVERLKQYSQLNTSVIDITGLSIEDVLIKMKHMIG
ncbi:MAG: AAA family ATPase [Erysipelotrichales bacterium]|nr:AAA family ATPase [Erysipelotrichales bacterium]